MLLLPVFNNTVLDEIVMLQLNIAAVLACAIENWIRLLPAEREKDEDVIVKLAEVTPV